jgi:uncharacterized Zn finger protein (UPF0148 family)
MEVFTMYRKNCDRCNRPSFSSSEAGEWLCPICGNDLTTNPFFSAMTMEKVAFLPRTIKEPYKTNRPSPSAASDLWGSG